MLLAKSDMQNFPYVLRIIELIYHGNFEGTGTLISDGVKVRFVKTSEPDVSITCELYNHDSHSPAVFFVVDGIDMYDPERHEEPKGTEVTVSTEGFYIDLCGTKGFTFCGTKYDIDDSDLESTVFQLSTLHDDIPPSDVFCSVYNNAMKALNEIDMKYLNYISYDDSTVLESDFEELKDAYANLCKS